MEPTPKDVTGAYPRPATTPASPRLHVRADGTLASLPFLNALVQRFLVDGCDLDPQDSVTIHTRLAIQEALANVVRHAYAGRNAGPIELELAREANELVARLRDAGEEFDPRGNARAPETGDEALREGGYGIAIIERVMTGIEHSFVPGRGNELVLRKRLV